MKKLIVGTVALSAIGLADIAFAADMPVKVPPVAPVVYNWTGCYIGANSGWKWGRFTESVDTAASFVQYPIFAEHADLGALETTSGAAGGQVGCRWENAEHWVFGFEGDFDWTNLHGTVTNAVPELGPIVPGDYFDNRARWESSGRIVFGRSFDRWLVYGTGGIAVTRVEMDANFIPFTVGPDTLPGSSASDSKTLTGGTIGLGTAYMITKNWEIGAEYRYTFYRQDSFNLGNVNAACTFGTGNTVLACFDTTATGHKGLETQEVLFKLNYRFN